MADNENNGNGKRKKKFDYGKCCWGDAKTGEPFVFDPPKAKPTLKKLANKYLALAKKQKSGDRLVSQQDLVKAYPALNEKAKNDLLIEIRAALRLQGKKLPALRKKRPAAKKKAKLAVGELDKDLIGLLEDVKKRDKPEDKS